MKGFEAFLANMKSCKDSMTEVATKLYEIKAAMRNSDL